MIQSITKNHLSQLDGLIQKLSNEQFARPIKILQNVSIGSHVRHILEFYICLCEALESRELDYDLRKRDRTLETSTEKCMSTISKIIKEVEEYDTDFPIKLHADYSISEENGKMMVESTFYRELLYNVEHIVHHLAIIRIGATSMQPFIKIDENMGVAASTLRNKYVCAR